MSDEKYEVRHLALGNGHREVSSDHVQ